MTTCRREKDRLAEPWAKALILVNLGISRRRAARITGMNAKTLWNRLEKYRAEHGLPPLPDGRRKKTG